MLSLRCVPAMLALGFAAAPALSQTTNGPAAPDAAAVTVSLQQLNLPFDGVTDPAELKQKVEVFHNATQMIKSCDDVAGVAKDIGAEVTINHSVPLSALPPKLRQIVATMPIGTATPLFGEPGKYVRSVVLCGREPS